MSAFGTDHYFYTFFELILLCLCMSFIFICSPAFVQHQIDVQGDVSLTFAFQLMACVSPGSDLHS